MPSITLKFFGAVVISVSLLSCATMSKDECRHADWYLKGLEDGSQGYPETRLVEHGKACSRVNVSPNIKDYGDGHKKGVRLYCVPEKGYSEGRKGAAYNNVCPPELESNFLRAYRDGQELFSIQRNIDNLVYGISNNRSRIDSDYDQIAQLKQDVVNSDDGKERRNKMRQIEDLHADINNLEISNDRAAHELELFKNDLRIVEDKHYRMGYIK
jgi:hypothetical protein